MADLNVVTLVGRLTKDAELSKTKNGVSVLTFTLANNQDRKKKDSDEYESVPNYFYVSYFGERAEKICTYMTKGKCISVEGRLLQHTWTENNEYRSRLEIMPLRIGFISGGAKEKDADKETESGTEAEGVAAAEIAMNEFPYDEQFLDQ